MVGAFNELEMSELGESRTYGCFCPQYRFADASFPWQLHNERIVHIERSLCAVVIYPALPIVAQIVEANAVLVHINNVEQPLAQGNKLARIDVALEHRVLHPLAVV